MTRSNVTAALGTGILAACLAGVPANEAAGYFGGGACFADVDDDGQVAFSDLTALLAAWGPCSGCPEDIDGDGEVAFTDLTILLSTWGASC